MNLVLNTYINYNHNLNVTCCTLYIGEQFGDIVTRDVWENRGGNNYKKGVISKANVGCDWIPKFLIFVAGNLIYLGDSYEQAAIPATKSFFVIVKPNGIFLSSGLRKKNGSLIADITNKMQQNIKWMESLKNEMLVISWLEENKRKWHGHSNKWHN